MKRKRFVLVLLVSVFFVLGWSYPVGLERELLNAVIQGMKEDGAPPAPVVGELTDADFFLEGTAEAGNQIHIRKNGIPFLSGEADANGRFSIRMPLQNAGTVLDVHSISKHGIESPSKTVKISSHGLPEKMLLDIPHISQLPELERGCEVTSLAMMLKHAGAEADKLKLAKEITKDPTAKIKKDGQIYFGNPEYGFVGDMVTYDKPGFGVFDIPVKELGEKYLPGRMINLTGKHFDEVLRYVSAGHPVWVVTTSTFGHVPEHLWEVWETAHGPVKVTMKMHSVLVTGYDGQFIYVNDPLDSKSNKKIVRESFVDGWTQYGQRAVSYF